MFLKQVVIDGFKSFADKVQINLPRGITCIVGPNGCGKSNIVDAIRWVLGEQSAKALRGGKMQDVIFQGTESRKPLQFCEVSLVFSDCEEQLGTQFNEVEISRKVFRDGGSEYYINGKSARLKDIQQLFMNTGVGRVSYSFMVQGQIDQILSSNPGDRRAIFEEAAGITKYKIQRKEALNKLALVDQNLARATDRIEEISRQIGSLKRQASKALRYKRLSFRLRHLDLAMNARNYSILRGDETESARESDRIASAMMESSAKLSEGEEKLLRLRTLRAERRSEMERLGQEAAELRSMKEQSERNSEFAVLRKNDLQERSERISGELKSLAEQLESLEGKAKGDMEVRQTQLELVSGSDEIFKEQTAELEALEERLRSAESALSRARQDALVAEGSITRLRSNCTSLELDLKSFQVRHAAVSDSIFQLKEESGALESRLAELDAASLSSEERIAEAENSIEESVKESDRLRGLYREVQAEIQAKDRSLAAKTARLSLLNDFQTRLEGFSDGVKAILKGKMPDIFPPDSVKIVSRNVEVDETWTSAFESLLGAGIDAVAIEDMSQISRAVAEIRSGNFGGACFQTRNPRSFSKKSDANVPGGIFPASEIVKSPNMPELAEDLIKGCWFCENISDFAKFASDNPAFSFALAVDRDGSVMDSRGIIFASSGEKKDTETSFILREKEIRKLKSEIEKDNLDLTSENEKAMSIQARLDASEAESESRRAVAAELRRESFSIVAQKDSARAALSQKAAEIERKTSELSSMENSRFEAQDRLDRARAELEKADSIILESRKSSEELEKKIAEIRILKDEKYALLSETRLDLASKRTRLENLERGLGEIEAQKNETYSLIARRNSELESMEIQRKNLDSESASEREKSEKFSESLSQTLAKIEESREGLDGCEKEISEFEKSLAELREAHIRESQQKNSIDVALAQIRSKLDFISERVLADYEAPIAEIDWKREMWLSDEEFEVKVKLDELEEDASPRPKKNRGEPTEEDFEKMDSLDFSAVEEEIKDLRERISSMGAVNLVAIEEYAELKERYDFLKTQTDDLWKSKNDLVSSIDEINKTSLTLFQETFEQIRKNFAFTFQKIFGGGPADLKLVESEDVLDSGIEIVARPAGTVLKSLSLLSGGQRTMTAVSLLFAIYMVKPSPFCVLDELDAPLDDANIGRYTDMLKEFTKYSQFLVISHNKHTVSAADTIYGVTMQERGVTKFISMKFDRFSNSDESPDDAVTKAAAQ